MARFCWVLLLLVVPICAGCAPNPDSGGAAGAGGTATDAGAAGAGGVAADAGGAGGASCSLTAGPGASPALATNGTTTLAVWAANGALRWSRLDASGAQLDVPPHAVPTGDVAPTAAVWNGKRFLAVWTDTAVVRVAAIDSDGTLSKQVDFPVTAQSTGISAASNGSVSVAVWADNSGAYALRLGQDGSALDASALTLSTSSSASPEVAWSGTDFVAAWSHGGQNPETRFARVTPQGQLLDPQGVVVAVPDNVQLLGGDSGVLASWIVRGTGSATLDVARVTSTLTLDTPVQVTSTSNDPMGGYPAVAQLSRSANGDLALLWTMGDDTNSYADSAVALDSSFAPVGPIASLDQQLVLERESAILGIGGSAHILLQAVPQSGTVTARKLTESAAGISAGARNAMKWCASPADAGP